MESNAEKHDLQASSLASLFLRVPKVADIIVYNLDVNTIRGLLLSTEPAIYHFCKGPGGLTIVKYSCFESSISRGCDPKELHSTKVFALSVIAWGHENGYRKLLHLHLGGPGDRW